MKVIPAREEHYEAVNLMAKQFIEDEFDMDEPFVSSMHMVEMCASIGVLALSMSGEEITGFTAGLTMPFVGNPDVKIMAEMAWWVKPEHRGGRSALALMNYLEDEAVLQGCAHLSMFSMVNGREAPVERIYGRRGMILRERTFHKRLRSPCQE